MSTLAIRLSTWNAASVFQRRVARLIAQRLQLGQPAQYSDGTNTWLVFDDHRFDLRAVAFLGAVFAKLATMTAGQQTTINAMTDADLIAAARNWLTSSGHVTQPESVVIAEGADPYVAVFQAQGPPAGTRFYQQVPTSWTAVGGGV